MLSEDLQLQAFREGFYSFLKQAKAPPRPAPKAPPVRKTAPVSLPPAPKLGMGPAALRVANPGGLRDVRLGGMTYLPTPAITRMTPAVRR